MALDLGPGSNYLIAAIVLGVILLLCAFFGVSLGILAQVLTVAVVVLVVAWALKLFGIL